MVDCSFLVYWSEGIRFGENSVSVGNFCFAVKVHFQLLKRLDCCNLWFHEHHSLALLASYLTWGLYVYELLCRHKTPFPED